MAYQLHSSDVSPLLGAAHGDEQQPQRPPQHDPLPSDPALADAKPKPLPPPPPSRSYVVYVKKDVIFPARDPPASQLPNHRCRGASSHRLCCCCFWWLLCLSITIIVLAAITAIVFFIVYHPKPPSYTVHKLSIQGFNLTSGSGSGSESDSPPTYSPTMDITMRASNLNSKIGIYYTNGGTLAIAHSDIRLYRGVLPVFYQSAKNMTVFQTALKGSDILLSTAQSETLREQQRKREIPLILNLKVPVKIKVGFFTTWTITVKARCYITVDSLIKDTSILSNQCGTLGMKFLNFFRI